MKVLLINQNPVIKKLVGMASKKLNLEVENVARIANDFRPKDYICIIVDDENVGKNLERLTALQDQVKVCLLFARKTQIKKHEFNIAIQKPFLPTDILEILNDCIPKEGEIKEADDEISNEGLEEYDNVKSINEIDMDLKSAEITPPDGINIDTAKLQAEAEEIAGEDTDSMLDFNPDSLDFSDLQAAGEVTSEEEVADSTDDENTEKENNTTDKEDSIKESEEEPEHRVGSIFDSDLSDLKPSSDNPLDLANFDLDSIVDSSALKAASLGIPAQIEEEAKEAADSLGDDEDDLFLSDDERDLLQPSPKKFMQAKKEEEELRAKEQENNADDTADTQSLENESLDDILDNGSLKNASDDSSATDIEADADTESASSDLDNIDLESLALQSDITQEKDDSIESGANTAEKSTDNLTAIDKKELDDMGLMDMDLDTQAPKSTPKPSVEHDIDSIDLSGLDETLSKQATQDTATTNTLDDAFDELSAALNSAFDNMILSGESSDETNDSKIEHDSNLQDLENIDSTTQTKDLDSKETENIQLDDLDLQIDETTNTDNSTESSLDSNPKEIDNLAQDESLETKEADELLLDSLDLDSMDITHDIESKSLDTENKEDDINSLLQLDDDLNLQSQESKEIETNDTQQLDSDLLNALETDDSISSESSMTDELPNDLIGDLNIDTDLTPAKTEESIDDILNIQEDQSKNTNANTLDDAFDDLTEALDNAFDSAINAEESKDSKEAENMSLDDLDLQINETANETENTDGSIESSLNSNLLDIDLDNKAKDDESLESLLDSDSEAANTDNLAQNESLESLVDDSSELLESKTQDSELSSIDDLQDPKIDENVESKETDELLLDSLDLDSMDITHDIESQSLDTENKEDDINSLLQLDDDLNLQSQESKEVETNDMQQLDNDLLDGLDSNDSPISTPDLESNTLDDLNGDLDKDLSIEIDDTKAPDSNQIDMDLEAMLNIDEELDTQKPDSKPQVLQEDTLAEVNEALEALNDEVALNDNTDLSQADDIKDELLDPENKDSMDLDNADDLLTDFLNDSDSSELDLQKDSTDEDLLHTQDGIDTDSNVLDDMLAELDSKNSTDTLESSNITSTNNSTKSLETNPDTLYVALPSNEEALENLTETELAEALGEITDLDIVRIDPNDINPNQLNQNKLDETQDTPAINTESSITDTQEIESSLNETQLDDTMPLNNEAPLDTLSTTDTISKDNVKELDANSLIDFFKNTPKEKLHEILDGSEINFSIHFGKDK
ncbi:MAG: hypothetical protein SPJ83_04250 [Helicobacter sp.]|uniref:hypothetical protein n=1 Tax=Helicobacter sp. TaxID=218 RepID=UPI002A90C747|nr:hypothetical protein [Helicobacter sp.]MDY5821997.1 hypothetical protein [Helicobacter sp.]